MDHALKMMHFSEEERDQLYRIVSVVLHLGSIDFASDDDGPARVVRDGQGGVSLESCAKLLDVAEDELVRALTTRKIEAVGESYVKELPLHGANDARDALAKTLYSRVRLDCAPREPEY